METLVEPITQRLLGSDEPSVRYKVRVGVVGEKSTAPSIVALRRAVKTSPRVQQLLANRRPDGRLEPIGHVYQKWMGAHWVLATLADIGYPPGDRTLRYCVADQILSCWLHPDAIREWVCQDTPPTRRRHGVPIVNGRARRCASEQGNALYSCVVLGFKDDRVHQLAELLIRWQWPDGGWNCDRKPEATHSSFWESLVPLRGLAAYARLTRDGNAQRAVERAADLFLKRHLYLRQSDGRIMNPQFVRLHYPCYWRYDILSALKVLGEAGFISDPRCRAALDLLESKRLPDGGWPAEERFYRVSASATSGAEGVRWGQVSRKLMNEWVTADALAVLKAAQSCR